MFPHVNAAIEAAAAAGFDRGQYLTTLLNLIGGLIFRAGIKIDKTGSVEKELEPITVGYEELAAHDAAGAVIHKAKR